MREKGRQWAILVKKLNDRRSEHSIKNKFNAILRKQQRLTPMFSELELIDSIISRARRLLCNKQMETNDEFIFGTSVKNLHEESERKPKKRINNYSSQEGINFNNKFQKFRKKLASFAVP